ncbi:pyridoxal-phosphate dependent enzyme [Silvanigrella paludirubra]|uniref:Pyridoxal-phosphate dependent enzyme n=1 Tax=Silvanigrella paludirubra TaxID=2499159 RepID=A0A6N6VVB8_9BACT|nr:pyridoxal-phosphate dependent enzyme [Silvanigrella paludirubra]KAB8039804.1 pyridoxal-phosphate dependent enzyme [Silvanigrella paludirubra]
MKSQLQLNKLNSFKEKVYSFSFANYPSTSRIHKLQNFSSLNSIYVKRDDELGFGASGSKLRKYLSLIPFLIQNKYHEVIVIGGAYSNNILTASQLLIENNIQPILFLPEIKNENRRGNFLLTSLLIDKNNIHFLNQSDFSSLNLIIENYCQHKKEKGINVGIIQEGANMKEALPGALSLCFDIIKNERDNNIEFNHIFVDSGTGLMAISLILGFSYLNKNTKIHVLQVAGHKDEFNNSIQFYLDYFQKQFQIQINTLSDYELYFPSSAKSFGSTNASIFKSIIDICRNNGIITDPIYSAKLFHEGKKIIEKNDLQGNILFIHSGGGLSLFGFQNELFKYYNKYCDSN